MRQVAEIQVECVTMQQGCGRGCQNPDCAGRYTVRFSGGEVTVSQKDAEEIVRRMDPYRYILPEEQEYIARPNRPVLLKLVLE